MHDQAVLCIGGMDPTGGAGTLADIKTVNQFGLQGFGVNTAITYQNESEFYGLDWLPKWQIIMQLQSILKMDHKIGAVKIGIIQSLDLLVYLLNLLEKELNDVPVIWDPVLRASAGYSFLDKLDVKSLFAILNKVSVITPNAEEGDKICRVLGIKSFGSLKVKSAVVLKGGHCKGNTANDILFERENEPFTITTQKIPNKNIHGSGCIFSTGLACGLASGFNIKCSFLNAKSYVYELLRISDTALASHYKVRL
ncbi:hydroxymethylpyrimidine/phosphomethylpyrimidine kinase [Mangrovivirga sp. M17]|uniref:hydroxymethylpyrimidine kinase n=1 Tax=Mangrovivirga halotolerans TaxID=2993936 RepID=A0ABT3RUT8_9BACT|nr:hydroxymethylpyrimidine/phosphomethylpyrimidine kinase [Mangrovivirga halotolerans]MCX2745547.1 hydroxymethylpyrimidine/phosphomethylpyrimidine kinase [Mangrovivirga halotolerans]